MVPEYILDRIRQDEYKDMELSSPEVLYYEGETFAIDAM